MVVRTDDVLGGHAYEKLMKDSGDEEYDQAGAGQAVASAHERREDVSLHELIDRLVPEPPVLAQAGRVPPLVVEGAVSEAHDLGERVEGRLEDGEEPGQPDDEGDGRQLQQPLRDGHEVEGVHLVEGVPEDRGGVLGAAEPDEDAQARGLAEPLQDEHPADLFGPWVDGLVDQRRRPPEVGQVAHGDVLGVRARRVDLGQRGELALDGVEVRVPQVSVREGVRHDLEIDDDDVELADGPDQRVVDVEIDGPAMDC